MIEENFEFKNGGKCHGSITKNQNATNNPNARAQNIDHMIVRKTAANL